MDAELLAVLIPRVTGGAEAQTLHFLLHQVPVVSHSGRPAFLPTEPRASAPGAGPVERTSIKGHGVCKRQTWKKPKITLVQTHRSWHLWFCLPGRGCFSLCARLSHCLPLGVSSDGLSEWPTLTATAGGASLHLFVLQSVSVPVLISFCLFPVRIKALVLPTSESFCFRVVGTWQTQCNLLMNVGIARLGDHRRTSRSGLGNLSFRARPDVPL